MRKLALARNGTLAARGVVFPDGLVVVRFYQGHQPASGVVAVGDPETGDVVYEDMGRSRMRAEPPMVATVTTYQDLDHVRESGFDAILALPKREARALRRMLGGLPRRRRGRGGRR